MTLFRRALCGDGRRYRLSMAAFNGSVDCGAARDIIDPKRFVESCRAVSALITRLSRRSQDAFFDCQTCVTNPCQLWVGKQCQGLESRVKITFSGLCRDCLYLLRS